MHVTLQTGANRLDFFLNGERFTSYHYGGTVPGFSALYASAGRAITQAGPVEDHSLWLCHGDVNGVAFGTAANMHGEAPLEIEPGEEIIATGRIVTTELMARRGAMSAGFRHACDWLAPDGRTLLQDIRIVRVSPGPSGGRILDLTLQLMAPEDTPVVLGRSEQALLCLCAAGPLSPLAGGQLRNSADDYDIASIHGHSAAWCGCMGVVAGETVGFVLLDHPGNPWHPTLWVARDDGFLSPAPCAWRTLEVAPRVPLVLRYRLLAHRGYVEKGWADARLAEFAQTPPAS